MRSTESGNLTSFPQSLTILQQLDGGRDSFESALGRPFLKEVRFAPELCEMWRDCFDQLGVRSSISVSTFSFVHVLDCFSDVELPRRQEDHNIIQVFQLSRWFKWKENKRSHS